MVEELQAQGGREGHEVVVPFSVTERAELRPVSAVRGMWVCTAMQVIRQRDLFDRYVAALPPALRTRIPSMVATEWVPTELVVAHQLAGQSLGLSDEDAELLGFESGERTLRPTLAALLVRAAAALTSSPWAVIGQSHRLWVAACRGGGVRVVRIHDREAQFEIAGFGPLAATPYARNTLRGVFRAALTPFAMGVRVTEDPTITTAQAVGYRFSW